MLPSNFGRSAGISPALRFISCGFSSSATFSGGRDGTIVKDRLPGIVRDQAIDLVIANGENSAAGFGITPALAEELFELNIDVITTGNHVWDKREILDYFQMVEGNGHGPQRRVLRPANYPADMPGWGLYQGHKGQDPLRRDQPAGTRIYGIE